MLLQGDQLFILFHHILGGIHCVVDYDKIVMVLTLNLRFWES